MSKQAYSKSKGRESENALVDYLRLRGFPAERRRLSGAQDMGDISGVCCWVIESKAEKRINLPGYLAELEAEVANANKRLGGKHRGFVAIKRRGSRFPGDWYACLPVADMVDILLALKCGKDSSDKDLTRAQGRATIPATQEERP